jgi:hypothetical protein
MAKGYEQHTVRQLRELIWDKGLLPKRWMLNYVRKNEAIELLRRYENSEEVPEVYMKLIKQRSSEHRKKVYRSRKNRQAKFGATLSREERFKVVSNTAPSLKFKERREYDDNFTSYLGSTRAKTAFVFVDESDSEYLFTKGEVQKLASMGLYVPRGTLSSEPAPTKSRKRLKDLFGDI